MLSIDLSSWDYYDSIEVAEDMIVVLLRFTYFYCGFSGTFTSTFF